MPGARIQNPKTTTLAQLPLSFELNRGQAAADATFVARDAGYALILTDRGEPALALHGQPHQTAESQLERRQQAHSARELREPAELAVLRLQFPGSNPAPQMQGEQLLPGRSNYLIGNDPKKWLTDVPHYVRVRYHEVYPGVDVIYYVKNQQLEYDFILRPGTRPDSIRMRVKGAQGIQPSDSGSLALKTAAGSVRLLKPIAYQQGPGGEREVACDYVLERGEVRFALGNYDHSRVLRIDPVLSYSTTLDALMKAIAVDSAGNTYLAGSTASANFPTTPGALQQTPAGDADALVAKLDPTGSTLLFATYLGGSSDDAAYAIAVDSSGNVMVAGGTRSANLPINHAFQAILLGNEDAFLSKLSPNGTQLLYSTYLGGSSFDSARGVALSTSGQALVAGITYSANFPTSTGALQVTYGGGDGDAFVAKLDTTQSGTASWLFSTYLGGSGEDAASGIALDAGGSAFVTGMTRSANFPIASAFQSACASCTTPEFEFDAFVSKLNANGTGLVYSTFLGGHARDIGRDVFVDATGNAYVAGQTSSLNFPVTTGAFQTSLQGTDAFVTKLNAAGSALMYSSYIGGSDFDAATGIAVDASGNAFLSGLSSSDNFPTVKPLQGFGGGACDVNGFGLFPCADAIVTQINANGSALIFSTYLGGGTDDMAARIAVDTVGNAYVAGTEDGTTMYTLGPLRAPEMSGIGFVAKISPASVGTEPTAITLTSSPNPSGQGKPATFAATVAPPGATGVVTFRDGGTLIGSASVSSGGTATHSHTSLSGGSHSITAEYWGDANFAASTSAVLTHVVTGISLVSGQASATVSKGASATFPLTVSQSGALTSAISFSCSGLPVGWSCGFNPTTVSAGSAPTQVMLTVQTAAATAQSLPRVPIESPRLPKNFWLYVFALLMLVFHISLRRRKQVYVRAATGLGFATLLLLAAGCGSGSSSAGTSQPVTANFTVNATSDSTTSSTSLTVTAR